MPTQASAWHPGLLDFYGIGRRNEPQTGPDAFFSFDTFFSFFLPDTFFSCDLAFEPDLLGRDGHSVSGISKVLPSRANSVLGKTAWASARILAARF